MNMDKDLNRKMAKPRKDWELALLAVSELIRFNQNFFLYAELGEKKKQQQASTCMWFLCRLRWMEKVNIP